jgi:prephenate dehydrogenase
MQDREILSDQSIAIIGLGLMGGSLAIALRGKCHTLIGIDPDFQTRKYAIENKIVDQVTAKPEEILYHADVIILAAPVSAIIKIIGSLPDMHPGQALVLDIGSTKEKIVQAMADLPDRFTPIGGHPICGKENLTIHNAEADLFVNSTFVFTPVGQTTDKIRQFAEQLAASIGATPVWLSAERHDQILAATSHAPYLIAAAVAAATPRKFHQFTGPGFQSATRLAATPASMMLEILVSNRENVILALEKIQDQLSNIQSNLQENDLPGLFNQLDKITQEKNLWGSEI